MADIEQGHIMEIIPAYALGCLDAGEAASASRHLAGCEICQAELATYDAVVDVLPWAAPDVEPSQALKGRLLARVSSMAAGEKETIQPPITTKPSGLSWWQQATGAFQSLVSGPRWRPVALLFVFALVVGNVLVWQQANQPDPNSWRRIRLTGSEVVPEAMGIIYISADGRNGTLIVDQLPQLAPEQQYQLWLVKDGERASGAVFSVDNDGYRGLQIISTQPPQDFNAFGITIEPAGGSPGPTGDRVLGYNPQD
jgi:anti-sigma-K factor RskA